MRRILFVDDEQRILDALERMLHNLADEWEMHFAASGAEALALLEQQSYDVIVSDMRMPQMDGATLLAEVKRRHPATIRIVLSGYAEQQTAMRSVSVAHQFLAKPSPPSLLREVVERACTLQQSIESSGVREVLGKVDALPTRPEIYSAIVEALADPNVTVRTIAGFVERDLAMSAKVLQLVNSAFIGLRQEVTSIGRAIQYIGVETLKALVLNAEVFRRYDNARCGGLDLAAENAHALAVAKDARDLLVDNPIAAQDAFMAGLLHDIGKLILAAHFGERYAALLQQHRNGGEAICELERRELGMDHEMAGAYLLGIWGLPHAVVEAVAHHHAPWKVVHQSFDALAATYLANALAQPPESAAPVSLDRSYLARLKLPDRIQALCRPVQTKAADS